MVYAKPPFGSPEQVLAYLGRYTHRVAIANSRLLSLAEWWLGVNHPVEAPEFAKTTCEGLRFGKADEIAEEPQLAGREGVLQLLQEQPAE